jgi:pimeloyl-ACP methyl ester carboxylesterase
MTSAQSPPPPTHGSPAPLLHYEVHGRTGPYLLLVHGMLASRAHWLLNLDALSTACRPVVVELFGHGRSPAPADTFWYRPQGYVEQFEHLRAALGADAWLVCGQSLGAALTLRYALDYPERVRAQVFTNSLSALAEDNWAALVRPFMDAQAQQLAAEGRAALEALPMHPSRSRHMPAQVQAALVADCALHDPHGIALTGLHTVPESPVRARVAHIRLPTLLVCGERETRFAPHRRFAEATMPALEVVGLDAGHAVNIDAAAAFNAAVLAFFRRHQVVEA